MSLEPIQICSAFIDIPPYSWLRGDSKVRPMPRDLTSVVQFRYYGNQYLYTLYVSNKFAWVDTAFGVNPRSQVYKGVFVGSIWKKNDNAYEWVGYIEPGSRIFVPLYANKHPGRHCRIRTINDYLVKCYNLCSSYASTMHYLLTWEDDGTTLVLDPATRTVTVICY